MNRSSLIVPILALPLILWISACTAGEDASTGGNDMATPAQAVIDRWAGSPYLGDLRDSVLYGEIWERPQLSKRDRSMITMAALQALYRDQLRGHIGRALDNGVTQEEISEIILQVTFYGGGWPAGVRASGMAGEVFQERGLTVDQTMAAAWDPPGLPPQEYTSGGYAAVPRLGELRNSLLYGDVWERPQLSKRDRSMVTVAALQALYRDQARGHIGRALNNGVTQEEISELILHVMFYSDWPSAVKAGGFAAAVFEERGLPLGGGGE